MARLTVRFAGDSQNIESEVVVKAPVEKVFVAHTDADLFAKWWARGNQMKVHTFAAIDGGSWHITEISDHGEFSFFGTFHEVARNTRIVQTFEFLGMNERGHVALERADFTSTAPDETRISIVSTYQSIDDAKAMVESGMEDGFRESVYALGALLGDRTKE